MIGVLQRSTEDGRLVWLFNESVLPQIVQVTLRVAASSAEWFDPDSGSRTQLPLQTAGGARTLTIALAGARGGILFLPD
jgi:hypothetical protein